jgi:hypothetical protein
MLGFKTKVIKGKIEATPNVSTNAVNIINANKAKVEMCDVQTETVNGLTRKDFPSIQNYQDWIADRVDPFLSVSIYTSK